MANTTSRPTQAAPRCEAPSPYIQPPSFDIPEQSCDTHAHVVSDDPRYPMVAERSYTPPPATEADYLAMLDATGMARGVLVQISVNGTDNRYMLSALHHNPDRLRGVAVVDPRIGADELAALNVAGVRGTRLNVLFGGGIGFDGMEMLADKIAPLGWHLQLLLDARQLPELMPRLIKLPVPVVVDHMGHMPAALGVDHPAFESLLSLVRDHDGWVKLSGAYRVDPDAPDYPAAREVAIALTEAAPDRCVYGSDWPHVAPPYAMPDTGRMRNLIGDWITDPEVRRAILVDNPARLYDFKA